jgi:hypothetical protein
VLGLVASDAIMASQHCLRLVQISISLNVRLAVFLSSPAVLVAEPDCKQSGSLLVWLVGSGSRRTHAAADVIAGRACRAYLYQHSKRPWHGVSMLMPSTARPRYIHCKVECEALRALLQGGIPPWRLM